MRDWHGLGRVIDVMAAAANRDELHYLVVGDGLARAALEAQTKARDMVDQLTVMGIIARDDVTGYVAAFDIALQPQVVKYASPLKLFEYMALGRAIVASDRCNIREVLTHGMDALLIDPANMEDFATATSGLVGDGDLCLALGRGAIETIHALGFTWDANAARVEYIFAALLDGKI